jgi:hypothetical protein
VTNTTPLTKQNVNIKRKLKRPKRQKRTKTNNGGAFDKWIAFREHMSESDIKQQMTLNSIAEYLKKVLPDYTAKALFLNQALSATTVSRAIQIEAWMRSVSFSSSSLPPVRENIFESAPSTSQQLETPVKRVQGDDDDESDDDDDDDVYIEPEVQQFGREQFG